MPNYNLEKSVPWREVLDLHRWYLKMRISDYTRLCAACPNREALLEQQRQKVKNGYRMYGALRSFLGCRARTKIEMEAMAIIGGAPDEKSGDML